MVVKFALPLYLLLFPICVGVIVFFSIKFIKNRFDRVFFTIIRCIGVLLVILSLAGTSILNYTDSTTHIFLVDMSASMEGTIDGIIENIYAANKYKPEKDTTGVVCFGQNAAVESLPSFEGVMPQVRSVINQGYTNIAEGLNVAQSIIPENTKKHIILVSDGGENLGDAVMQAKLINDNGNGVAVSVMPVNNRITKEVALTEIKVPKYLKQDSRYDIEVTAYSLSQAGGKLLVYKNNQLIYESSVSLRTGENKFVFTDVSEKSGGVIYRAEILPEEDTFAENNTTYGFSQVEGVPSILLADFNESSDELYKLLQSAKVEVASVASTALPTTLEQLMLYDGIILPDIHLDNMPQNFPELIEAYVKSGGGLLVTGGEESYGLGDYKDTPIETVLPVNMELKDKNKQPTLGMMVVLDRSGSMGMGNYGISKLEIAKEAVIRSLSTLNDNDYLGVIMFDDQYNIASEFQNVGQNREGIENNIASIQLGGGTSILPALNEAYRIMSGVDTKIKHVILLTDGIAEQYGYTEVISGMVSEGITLSSVAVGGDSDMKLLKRLAFDGGGRYYYSDEFSDLPKIFARETNLAGKTFLNNETFIPTVTANSQILTDINFMPALNGYVSTTPKDRADVILQSEKEEVVLASWQYGLGRAVAFTSDTKGMWSGDWLSSNDGVQIIKNMVSWVMQSKISADVTVTAETEDNFTKLSVSVPYAEGVLGMKGTVVAPDMTEHKVNFSLTAPGRFEGRLNAMMEGAYIANLELNKNSGNENIVTGVSIPYPKEFDIRYFEAGEGLLDKIAQITNGQILTDAKDAYGVNLANVFGQKDFSGIFIIIALILFLLDIFARRFPVVSNVLQKSIGKLSHVRIEKRKQEKPVIIKKTTLTENTRKTAESKQKDNKNIEKNEIHATSSMLIRNKKKRNK